MSGVFIVLCKGDCVKGLLLVFNFILLSFFYNKKSQKKVGWVGWVGWVGLVGLVGCCRLSLLY